MREASVRYIANDVPAAAAFYMRHLGFTLELQREGFAILKKGNLRLLLNAPGAGGAGQPGIDGKPPEPGGWNRFQLEVESLDRLVAELRNAGVHIRTDVIVGEGGKQALVEDPDGNPIELFEPRR